MHTTEDKVWAISEVKSKAQQFHNIQIVLCETETQINYLFPVFFLRNIETRVQTSELIKVEVSLVLHYNNN